MVTHIFIISKFSPVIHIFFLNCLALSNFPLEYTTTILSSLRLSIYLKHRTFSLNHVFNFIFNLCHFSFTKYQNISTFLTWKSGNHPKLPIFPLLKMTWALCLLSLFPISYPYWLFSLIFLGKFLTYLYLYYFRSFLISPFLINLPRIIFKSWWYDHIILKFKIFQWLRITWRLQSRLLSVTQKHHFMMHTYLSTLLTIPLP